MKRKGYLYQDLCNFKNIENAYNEVCRNTRNKRKVALFREYKCSYISSIYKTLENRAYIPRCL